MVTPVLTVCLTRCPIFNHMASISSLLASFGIADTARPQKAPAQPNFQAPEATPVRGGVEIRLSPAARQALEAYRPSQPMPQLPEAPQQSSPRRLDLRV